MTKDSAVPVKIEDGSVLWLRAGDMLVVAYGGSGATNLARVVDPTRPGDGRIKVRKFYRSSHRWTKRAVVMETAAIKGRHNQRPDSQTLNRFMRRFLGGQGGVHA